ncbi:MAG: hypothetical protein RR162_00340 [Oscillospiraceae bacterium]
MANIIIKSEERQAHENRIMKSYGANLSDRNAREAAEIVAARSNEAYSAIKKMEEKNR